MADLRQLVLSGFNALAANRQAGNPTQEPMIAEIPDDQVENAIAEGKGAGTIRAVARAEAAKAMRDLKAGAIDPLSALVNQYGIEAITALAREAAANSVEPEIKPYVDRYGNEISNAINSLAPELKMKAEHIRDAQAYILGKHIKEIIATEREQAVRRARENPTDQPGKAGRTTAGSNKVPTAEEIFGKAAAREVAEQGGEDAWAQKRGYSDFADFLTKTNAIEGNA